MTELPPSLGWWALAIYAVATAGLLAWRRLALTRRVRTFASVVAAFREGDFSVRPRIHGVAGPMREALEELSALGDTLRSHRLGEIEAWNLLRKVLAEIDVVVLAFTRDGRVRLANDAAARALRQTSSTLSGREAASLGLEELLAGEAPRVLKGSRALGGGPWELRRGSFQLAGETHALVVLSDVSGALREQERESWKRLIRVIGHEINNSLAPIQSISESLQKALARSPRAEGLDEDIASGLSIVGRRADSLGRFMSAYASLARLPPPKLAPLGVGEWVSRVAKLEQRLAVMIEGGPDLVVRGDADQLDQLLINLVKNAVEATLESGGSVVTVGWSRSDRALEVVVRDEGPGISDTANLFVPFFTTKSGGSGIGLALSRQIAEAHGGDVTLASRRDGDGSEARVRIPLR